MGFSSKKWNHKNAYRKGNMPFHYGQYYFLGIYFQSVYKKIDTILRRKNEFLRLSDCDIHLKVPFRIDFKNYFTY